MRPDASCVDIVIVNWNAGAHLSQCIDSVLKHGGPALGRIIVVDNGSTDGSAEAVATVREVTVVRAGTNLGFARACNLGAAHGDCAFVLFLNPDARLLPGSLERVMEFMDRRENSRVGVCGVQLVGEQGRIERKCARFPSAGGIIARAFGLDRVFASADHVMRDWDHASTREVDQVMGAFFLVRRPLFEALRGFDEQFFVYFEDVDFAYRARQHGWSNMFFADAQVLHAGGISSRQVKAERLFYVLRSRILYTFKHMDGVSAAGVVAATLLIEPLTRSVFAIANASWTSLKETGTAYRMLVGWLLGRRGADGGRLAPGRRIKVARYARLNGSRSG